MHDPFEDNPWHQVDVPDDAEYVLVSYDYLDGLAVEAGLLHGLSDLMQKEVIEAFRDEGVARVDDGKLQTVVLPGPAWGREELETRLALLED